jgi:hypothetical protein
LIGRLEGGATIRAGVSGRSGREWDQGTDCDPR